jgi:hypothetical protein
MLSTIYNGEATDCGITAFDLFEDARDKPCIASIKDEAVQGGHFGIEVEDFITPG